MACTNGNWKELLSNGRVLELLGKYRIDIDKLNWVTEMNGIGFHYC